MQEAMEKSRQEECGELPSVSEYEEIRKRNMEDNKLMLARLMAEVQGTLPAKPQPVRTQAKRQRKDDDEDSGFIRRNPSRTVRRKPTRFEAPRTRSRSGSVSSVSSSSSSTPASTPEKMVVRFGFFRKPQNLVFDSQEGIEEEDGNLDLPSPSRRPRVSRDSRSVEDITEEDLGMVAVSVSDKRYDSIYGTTCHQCRQKTDDFKTICRNRECGGVKGQFCGPCLRNRYGEDAKEVLKDPEWVCPPCRGICNCSFCRRRGGKGCTGILIHLARDRGYDDVHSYLKGLCKPAASSSSS